MRAVIGMGPIERIDMKPRHYIRSEAAAADLALLHRMSVLGSWVVVDRMKGRHQHVRLPAILVPSRETLRCAVLNSPLD